MISTLQTRVFTICALLASILAGRAAIVTVASSDWNDTSSQGWTLGSDTTGFYEVIDSGGNPDGYVGFVDGGGPGNPGMFAPASYLGDYLTIGASEFTWDAKVATTAGEGVSIYLSGPGGFATFDGSSFTTNTSFASYSAPIVETSWIVSSGTWAALLADVTELRLSLDLHNGLNADGAVDNFTLKAVPEPSAILLVALSSLALFVRRSR